MASLPFERTFLDRADLERSLARELAFGGAFVACAAPPRALATVDLRFTLLSGGAVFALTGTAVNVPASGGGFFVQLDRGAPFDGFVAAARRCLESPAVSDLAGADAAGAIGEPEAEAAPDEVEAAPGEAEAGPEQTDDEPSDDASREAKRRLVAGWDLIDPASTIPVARQVSALSIPDRIRLARFANGPVRKVLIRDSEKRIHLEVARNPKTTDMELEEWSGLPAVSPEVLRWIAGQKRLAGRLGVQLNLAMNPSTPADLALKFLAVLPLPEVQRIAKSTRVRENIRNAAKKRVRDASP
jgi:hypothetical protein